MIRISPFGQDRRALQFAGVITIERPAPSSQTAQKGTPKQAQAKKTLDSLVGLDQVSLAGKAPRMITLGTTQATPAQDAKIKNVVARIISLVGKRGGYEVALPGDDDLEYKLETVAGVPFLVKGPRVTIAPSVQRSSAKKPVTERTNVKALEYELIVKGSGSDSVLDETVVISKTDGTRITYVESLKLNDKKPFAFLNLNTCIGQYIRDKREASKQELLSMEKAKAAKAQEQDQAVKATLDAVLKTIGATKPWRGKKMPDQPVPPIPIPIDTTLKTTTWPRPVVIKKNPEQK